jgi:hypothetical protein
MNTTNNLSVINSLVLVKFASTAPSTSVLHKGATASVCSTNGAKKKTARVRVTTIERAGTAIGRAASLVNVISQAIRKVALPCPTIEGASYVQAKDVDHVQRIFDDGLAKLAEIRREICSEWPALVSEARVSLGALAYEIEWPTGSDFASRFDIKLTWMGQPAAITGTVLEGVSNEVAARVRASSEAGVKAALLEAHGSPIRDLLTELIGTGAVTGTIDQLSTGKRIRRERFDNIREHAARIKSLNWLQIPELDALVAALESSVEGIDGDSDLSKSTLEGAVGKIKAAKTVAENTLAALGI